MAAPDPLTLAVRGHAAWCDLVCRLHRFAPEGDARLWWSARRTPDLCPDAVTLVPEASEFDVLSRINDSFGASVSDSFATLDLTGQGWTVLFDGTWVARPPGSGGDEAMASAFAVVRERFAFAAWCRAWGGQADALPTGLRRASGVTVLGREGDGEFVDGGMVHRTEIGGTAVAGLWNVFGAWAEVADAVSRRHPEAWVVSCERGAGLDAALTAGFNAIGPLRLWTREPARP
jgi:hypothetical protein